MSWFSVLKSTTESSREVRRQARPVVNQMVEQFASDKNEITPGELEAFVREEITNSGIFQNSVLPNHSPNHRGRLIRSSHSHFVNMAFYKIREMGFTRVDDTKKRSNRSVYVRGDGNV